MSPRREISAQLRRLLDAAILAPSGHNAQPWLFRAHDDAVEVYADRRQALPVVDPGDRELTISCGAALLNLRVAARRLGFRDDPYELLPDPGNADLLARLRLVEGEDPLPGDEALFDAIPGRRTTRTAFEERAVPGKVERELEAEAAREGAWLHLVGDGERETVAGLVAEGDRVQMRDRRFRAELAAWLRPNRSRAMRGMRGYGFGFGDLTSLATPLVIRAFDLGRHQAAKDRELALRAPVLAVIGTAGDSPREWLEAGQALERVLLRARSRGLVSAYLNQPVEVDALRPRLAEAVGRSDAHPQLVVRAGYGPEAPHQPRVPVESVLVPELRDG